MKHAATKNEVKAESKVFTDDVKKLEKNPQNGKRKEQAVNKKSLTSSSYHDELVKNVNNNDDENPLDNNALGDEKDVDECSMAIGPPTLLQFELHRILEGLRMNARELIKDVQDEEIVFREEEIVIFELDWNVTEKLNEVIMMN